MNSKTKLHVLQETVAIALRATMIPLIVREVFQRNKVTIVYYHAITAELFERHLAYLTKHYSIISLEQFIQSAAGKDMGKLPEKPLVITFDDGKKITYELKPVIQKYGIPVTYFVCGDITGTNRHFWFDHTPEPARLKKVADSERLKLLEKTGFDEKKDYGYPEALSEAEVADLLSIGVSIQSHGLTHPILPMCNDAKAEAEIAKSKPGLEKRFGIDVDVFSYPNGDYCPRDVDICKQAGYLAAVTVEPGFNDMATDLYRLKRISIHDSASVNQLAVRAAGVWHFAKRMIGKRV